MNVLVLKEKLDALANAIGIKARRRVPQTLDELVETVNNMEPDLQEKTVTITTKNFEVAPDSGYDGISALSGIVADTTYTYYLYSYFWNQSGIRKWFLQPQLIHVQPGWLLGNSYGPITQFNAISANMHVTPTKSTQTIGGTKYIMEGAVTVNPIPSQYIIPSGTTTITSNGTYNIKLYASAEVNVSGGGGGDHDAEDAIIARTISGAYENSRITNIGSYAFYYCSQLTTASFPNATSIGNSAFYYCSHLTTASFPSVTSIGSYAFYYCSQLTTASFPSVTSIGSYAFYYCSKLTTASFPSVTSIGNSAFQFCSELTTASFPVVRSFGVSCFRACRALESLYVLSSSVPTLGSSVFALTPMSLSSYLGHFGSIYVPASLVDSYKSAPNWSAYSSRITAYVE